MTTFIDEHFMIGQNNLAAVHASEAIADNLGAEYNPLILHGPSGCGKTYLAHALARYIRDRGFSIRHLSAFEFVNELVWALSNQAEDEFREELMENDLLIIDDLPYFVGRFGAQEELFLILDARMASNKQVIFTSVEHPRDLEFHNKQLASRLQAGLTVSMALADEAMQLDIVRDRLQAAGVSIPDEIVADAVRNVAGNGWVLQGIANQLLALAKQGSEINRETVAALP